MDHRSPTLKLKGAPSDPRSTSLRLLYSQAPDEATSYPTLSWRVISGREKKLWRLRTRALHVMRGPAKAQISYYFFAFGERDRQNGVEITLSYHVDRGAPHKYETHDRGEYKSMGIQSALVQFGVLPQPSFESRAEPCDVIA